MNAKDANAKDLPPRRRWLVIAVAFVTYSAVMLLGVVFWFRPIAESDQTTGPLVSAPLNLTIFAALSILLYDWAARRIGDFFATAFVLGAAQYILVIDLTLRGDRGVATAGASAVLIVVTWASVALVYRLLAGHRSPGA
jgi:hypothetical protein